MKTKLIIAGLMASATLLTTVAPVITNADDITDTNSPTNLTVESLPSDFVVSNDSLSTLISDDGTTTTLTSEQQDVANAIANYYAKDSSGNVTFTASLSDLMNLGLSQADAQAILDNASSAVTSPIRTRGFVGLHINLGTKTRNMRSWAAAAYVTGYVGWYLKVFATTPATAGAVALISAGVGASVKYAITHGIKRIDVGVNIPFVALSYTVATP